MADPDAAGRALLGLDTSGKFSEIPRLPQTATKNEYIIAINKLIDAHNSELTFKVYPDETGFNRMLVGYQKDGWGAGKSWGVKISKVGFDVLTAADADLLFKLSY